MTGAVDMVAAVVTAPRFASHLGRFLFLFHFPFAFFGFPFRFELFGLFFGGFRFFGVEEDGRPRLR